MSTINVATGGYLCSPISIATDGYLCQTFKVTRTEPKKELPIVVGGIQVPTRNYRIEEDDEEILLMMKIFVECY